jgi:membrane AbrB-like protein
VNADTKVLHWAALLALTTLLSAVLQWHAVPGALLLGALLAGMLLSTRGITLRIPRPVYFGAQSLVGTMIAAVITADIVVSVMHDWMLFLPAIAATILASAGIGWLLTRWQVLPGTTAVWGISPGAASAMMLMSEAYGADVRLVAFMQYLRSVLVAITAAVAARLWIGSDASLTRQIDWLAPVDLPGLAATLAVAAVTGIIGRFSGLPSAGFLLPFFTAAALNATGLLPVVLPPWLLAACFILIGWNVGLGFTRAIILYALRVLPQLAASAMALIGFCALVGLALSRVTGVDALSTYLATSPGGMDTVAIIAASTTVDLPFVMALQVMRYVVVMLTGPWLARLVADRAVPR